MKLFSTCMLTFFAEGDSDLKLVLEYICAKTQANFLSVWKDDNGKFSVILGLGRLRRCKKEMRFILTNWDTFAMSELNTVSVRKVTFGPKCKIIPFNYKKRVQYQNKHNDPWLLWKSPAMHGVSIMYVVVYIYKYMPYILGTCI